MSKKITVEEIEYNSISDAYRAYQEHLTKIGVSEMALRLRLSRDWPIDQAFELVPAEHHLRRHKPVTVEGVQYPSIAAAYAANRESLKARHICRSTLSIHLANGWSVDQAFGLAPAPKLHSKKFGMSVTVNGVEYDILADAYKAYKKHLQKKGISKQVLAKRLATGWPVDQAFGFTDQKPLQKGRDRAITVNGKEFRSVSAAYKAYENMLKPKGVSYDLVLKRLELGWKPEEAFAFQRRNHPAGVTIGGTQYESITQFAETEGVWPALLVNKVRCTPEDALEKTKASSKVSFPLGAGPTPIWYSGMYDKRLPEYLDDNAWSNFSEKIQAIMPKCIRRNEDGKIEVSYRSAHQLWQQNHFPGIGYNRFRQKLANGASIDEALGRTAKGREISRGRKGQAFGGYPSVTAFCRAEGIHRTQFARWKRENGGCQELMRATRPAPNKKATSPKR